MVNDRRLCSYKMVLQEPAHLLLTFPAVAMAATLIRAPLSKQVFQQKPSISLTQTSVFGWFLPLYLGVGHSTCCA